MTPEELLTDIADNLQAGCYLMDVDDALVQETLYRVAWGTIRTLLKWERLDPIHREALDAYEGHLHTEIERIARYRTGESEPPPSPEGFLVELATVVATAKVNLITHFPQLRHAW